MAMYRELQSTDWQNSGDVLSCNKYMLENQIDCDVTFLLPGDRDSMVTIKAHKYVLVSRSPVFFAMLNGPLVEKNRNIKITDITPEGFWNLLRHMYYEGVNYTFDNVFHILYAAKKYIVTKLVQQCVTFLENIVVPENACLILDQSLLLDDKLEQRCLQIIQRNTKRVLLSETFFRVSQFTLAKILQCERLSLNEIEVFKACDKWSELQCSSQGIDATPANKREVLGAALSYVYVSSLTKDEFTRTVVPTKLLTLEEENVVFRYLMGDSEIEEQLPFAKGRRLFFAFKCTLNYDRYVRHTTAVTPLYDGFIRRCRWSMTFQCDHTISLHGVTLCGQFQGTVAVCQGGQKLLEYSSQVAERSIKFDDGIFLEAGQFTIVTDATSSYSGNYFYKTVHSRSPQTECDHENVKIEVKECTSLSFISHLYYTHSEDLLFVDEHFSPS